MAAKSDRSLLTLLDPVQDQIDTLIKNGDSLDADKMVENIHTHFRSVSDLGAMLEKLQGQEDMQAQILLRTLSEAYQRISDWSGSGIRAVTDGIDTLTQVSDFSEGMRLLRCLR